MKRPLRKHLMIGCAALLLTACGQPEQAEWPPVAVSSTRVTTAAVQLFDDLPGRVVAQRTAEIRPQVGGIVQRKLFAEGSMVRAGQPLFQLNAAPFRADANSAAADLKRALANRDRARVQVSRLESLVAIDAVSQGSFDDARSALLQAEAEVAAAEAGLARRKLDVDFATVRAPISGRIGVSAVTEGALVGVTDGPALATIHQTAQVYVDVQQPAARLEQIGGAENSRVLAEILDADGVPMGISGRIMFSEASVSPETGDVTVRILVDNPTQRLLPGMFVRARLPRGAAQELPRIPQQALVRQAGSVTVYVVSADRTSATPRPVQVGEVVDGQIVVRSGLRPGEHVLVEGQDRMIPGVPITVQEWRPTRKVDAAPAQHGGQ